MIRTLLVLRRLLSLLRVAE